MCLLARHGSRCHRLHQAVPNMHQKQQPTVETLHPHEVPPGPWVKIGVDFFQDHLGKNHLIVADYSCSKFPYIFPVASTHHFKTISHLRELFAAEGVPTIIMSDNRPPFNGDEFRQFFP